MAYPRGIGVIDTLIGFRKVGHTGRVAAARVQGERHPAEYMYKDIPEGLSEQADDSAAIADTLAAMDAHNIRVGLISLNDPRAPQALRQHPDRFVGAVAPDPIDPVGAVRAIVQAKAEHGARAVSIFASGLNPPTALNDRRMYPIYAKCVELDLPVFANVGVPGPLLPMMPQYVGYLDEICYDFPELKLVMRHGAEPWEKLAVKLMLKWPNLYYSTSAFAPKYYPKAVVDFANTRGANKIMYGGYFPMGLELDRIFREFDLVGFKDDVWPKFLYDNAAKVLGLPPRA